MDYLFLCIFSFVPKRAIFGRGQVASSILALSISSIIVAFLLIFNFIMTLNILNIYNIIVIYIVPIVFLRWYYLDIKRYRKVLRLLTHKNLVLTRSIGIMFFILAITSPMIVGIIVIVIMN